MPNSCAQALVGSAKAATSMASRCRTLVLFDLVRVEAEELGRLVRDALLLLVQGDYVAHFLDVFPEIPLVKFLVQHRFIQRLELTEREFFRKQFKADVVAFQLRLEGFQRAGQYGVVVKSERPHVVDVHPAHTACK